MDKLLLEDRHLWQQLKQGNQLALTAIYRKHVVGLYEYGHRFGLDQASLEDGIQDLFLTLWRQRASLSVPSSIKYYLFSAFRNQLLDNLKHQSKSKRLGETFARFHIEIAYSPEELATKREAEAEKITALRQALSERLTSRQREAITLFFYDGFTYDEVASLLSMSTKATYKLIYRALSVLRVSLNDTVFLYIVSLLTIF